MNVPTLKALLFDTFGTVVNWRDSVIDDFRSFGRRVGIDVNWEAFVDEWKAAYRPGMDAVRTGKWPWTRVDRIYRMKLDDIIPKYGLDRLGEEESAHLNRVWHRLRPWPDAVAGLDRLKRSYVIAPLSNSDLDCLVGPRPGPSGTRGPRHSPSPYDNRGGSQRDSR